MIFHLSGEVDHEISVRWKRRKTSGLDRIISLPKCRIIRHNSRGGYMTAEGKAYLGTILISVVLILLAVGFISEGPKHIPAFAAYAAGAVLILLVIPLNESRSFPGRAHMCQKCFRTISDTRTA